MIPDDQSRLRKIERDLYTTDIKPPTKRGFLHDRAVDAPEDWNDPAKKTLSQPMTSQPTNNSIFKKIFFGSLGFLILAVIILGVSFLTGSNSISAQNVEVNITAASFVDGGQNLPVQVDIVNKNKVDLQLATLTLEYPDGTTTDSTAVSRITRDVGTVAVGDTHTETFNVQLYGPENSQKTITAHIEFHVAGSNAVYDKDQTVNVTLSTSPVNLTLNAASSAVPNQVVPLAFTVVGNGTTTLANTGLVLNYPQGFTFSHATPSPSFANNVWDLGNVAPGSTKTITVYGSFTATTNNASTIGASVGLQDAQNEQTLDTVYNSLSQVITLTDAFLDAQMQVNGSTNPTIPISSNSAVSVTINWQNTLSSQITNAEIDANLSGTAYDPGSIQPGGGYFDTANNKIVWTSQQDTSLGTIAPGATGEETFSFTPKQFGANAIVSNPSVVISIDVKGFQTGGGALSATAVDQKTFVINSDLNLIAQTIHYSGSIQNSGPMPLVPNKQTTYTLNWQITNFRNDVSGVVVSTTLPTYVSWKNVIVPQAEASQVTYNSVTQALVWNVGDVPAGTGSSTSPKTLSLQVGITPSATQEGSTPLLTGPITITGHDTFTNQDLSFTHREMSTQLLNDTSSVGADGVVQ